MAIGDGTRDVVSDPLALNPMQRGADRSLPTYGIRNPGLSAGKAATTQGLRALDVIEGLQATASRIFQTEQDNALTNGKIAYMQGKTEAEIAASDGKYGQQGWQAMKSVNDAQSWFANEANFISNEGQQMDPAEYANRIKTSMKQVFDNLPNDPAVRKSFLAAYDGYAPRLAAAQVEAHNKYNEDRSYTEFSNLLTGSSSTSADASSPVMGGTFRVNAEQVAPAISYSADDRDTAIRTMLGEAGGEGALGMAGVAHVLINRSMDKRYGGSIKKVALEPKQFSAWNTGEGGNNPLKWDQNSDAYKRAGAIWDAVAQGHHVDPTGGATHYFNAASGVPSWAADEEAKAGGKIQIGSHTYLGNPGSTAAAFLYTKTDKGKESIDGLNPSFQNGLAAMIQGSPFGDDLGIYSGYRSSERQAEILQDSISKRIGPAGVEKWQQYLKAANGDVVKAGEAARPWLKEAGITQWVAPPGKSEHQSGMAVDMSYKGKSLEYAPQEVKDWVKNNASAYGLNLPLDNEPWHVELTGARDKSANDATITTASADTGGSVSGSRLQRLIQASPLPNKKKAQALADGIRRQLATGDDTLFNDAGGIATLQGLGANPSDIDEVLKAKQRFDDEQGKKFDLNAEKARAQIITDTKAGVYTTVEQALDAVDKFHRQFGVGEAESKSLAREVANNWQQAGNDIVPLELRDFGAQLHDGINSGRITPNEASQQIIEFGKKNKIKDSVVNNFVDDMYRTAQSKKDRDATAVKTEMEKQAKEQLVINRANGALTRGSGLKGLTGTVRIPDPDNPGQSMEVSGEEYGVWALKKNTMDDYNKQVSSGQISKEKAQTSYYNDVYSNLARQGVFDKEFGRQMSAAVTGDLFNKDKTLSDGALHAVDVYMQLRDNPNIGSAYVAGMIDDPQARTFLETAATMYDHRNDISQALMAASSILSQKLTPPEKLEKTQDYFAKRTEAVTNVVNNVTQRATFWQRFMPGTFSESDIAAIKSANTSQMNAIISNNADIYHLRNPQEPMQVSINKAADDLANNAIAVGHNLIVGDQAKGTRLDQVMGLTQQGTDAPHKAFQEYIKTIGPAYWKDLYKDQFGDYHSESSLGDLGMRGAITRDEPNFQFTYIPGQGMEILMIAADGKKDKEGRSIGGTQIGRALYVDPKTVGDWYKKKIGTGEAPFGAKTWRNFVDTVADRNQFRNAESAGSDIGSMFKPK